MKDQFICQRCGAKLTCYESWIEYHDEETIIIEHYECPECRKHVDFSERIATYRIEKRV